jgi:hypothetical protein
MKRKIVLIGLLALLLAAPLLIATNYEPMGDAVQPIHQLEYKYVAPTTGAAWRYVFTKGRPDQTDFVCTQDCSLKAWTTPAGLAPTRFIRMGQTPGLFKISFGAIGVDSIHVKNSAIATQAWSVFGWKR